MKTTKIFFAILAFGVSAAFSVSEAWAQETIPTVEVGTSLSFESFHPGNGTSAVMEPGGSASVVYNFNRVFSGVADFGGYHSPSLTNFTPTTLTYLFGPRVSLRHNRLTPYFQTLFGGARQSTSFVDPVAGTAFPASSGFAAAFGGGLDIQANRHVTIKPLQVEYLMTRVMDPLSPATSQNNIRYSTGVVFTFGSK